VRLTLSGSVRLGMLLVGALSPVRAAILAVVQILGAITGAAIIQALTPGAFERASSCLRLQTGL
jgi:glycerol uptake facilitator-like aquaporin